MVICKNSWNLLSKKYTTNLSTLLLLNFNKHNTTPNHMKYIELIYIMILRKHHFRSRSCPESVHPNGLYSAKYCIHESEPMCVHVCLGVYVCNCKCKHWCAYLCVRVRRWMCMCVYVFVHVCTDTCVCVYVGTSAYMCVRLHKCTCMFIKVQVLLCIGACAHVQIHVVLVYEHVCKRTFVLVSAHYLKVYVHIWICTCVDAVYISFVCRCPCMYLNVYARL